MSKKTNKNSKKSDLKNVSILEEDGKIQDVYKLTALEEQVVSSVFSKFRMSADDRNRNFEYFDGINLIDYIDDCVRRFSTNIDEREDIEDWQARIHNPFTRNKVMSILGKLIRVLPIAQFTGRGDEDSRKGSILTSLYEYSEEIDGYEELMINILLESIVKGTAIGFEGMNRSIRIKKDVENVDDDIKIVENKEIKTNLYGSTVPLEEFYPSSVGVRSIKLMPYVFWRNQIPYQQFLQDFSSFSKASKVRPQQTTDNRGENDPFYKDYISADIREGNVEIIRYYNKDVDEYIIIANGVWLNPITGKNGNEIISPLPWAHKELPFWEVKYELFGSDFFYGKSLPDKIKSLQDVLNVLENMLLDQSFLTVFPTLLTNGFDSIEDDYLRPGRRTSIDTQGLPINQAFMKLDLGTPSGWHQYILDHTKSVMEEATVDQVSAGTAGVGGRTTASEIRTAADGVNSTLGLMSRLINFGLKRKATLRASNILQFWTDKNSPMIEKILGEGGSKEMNEVFNTIKIGNTILSNGKRGTKIIEMYADKASLPTKTKLKARSMIAEKETDSKIEIVAILPEYIREFTYDVKLNSNPKTEGSKEIEKALQLEKVRVYMTFFPNLVNMEELAAQTAEKMGDDPTKVLKADVINPQPQVSEGQQQAEQAQGMGTAPQGNVAQNQIKSFNDLGDLQAGMLG